MFYVGLKKCVFVVEGMYGYCGLWFFIFFKLKILVMMYLFLFSLEVIF